VAILGLFVLDLRHVLDEFIPFADELLDFLLVSVFSGLHLGFKFVDLLRELVRSILSAG